MPVMVTCFLNFSPRATAINPAVVSAPALGPSMNPSVSNENSPSSGSPRSRVEMMAASQAPAWDADPMPPTSLAENSTRKSRSFFGGFFVMSVVPVVPVPSAR